MTPLEHALAYARLGWRVAPIPAGYKHPDGMPRWQELATSDPTVVGRWWPAGATDLGVCVVTGRGSGIFVVDVDPGAGGDDTLADLEYEHGPLPDTVEAQTANGGRHLYFALPAGVEIHNSAGTRLGPGLDIRGEGGQVVAAPSVHPTLACKRCNLGVPHPLDPYRWEVEHDPLDGHPVAMPPAWLIELLTVDPEPPRPRRQERSVHAASDRPGDRFEADTEWADLLTGDGWTLHSARRGRDGDYELWTRPGKDARAGASASLYYQGSDVLKVFTSSVPQLAEQATYTRFGYWAALNHGGDHSAAGRALAARYRHTDPPPPATGTPAGASAPAPRRSIVHNGRHLEDVTAEAIDALLQANTPPAHFVRAGGLVRVRADEEHRPLVETLTPNTCRLALADAAAWYRALRDGELTATAPPLDIATSVLGRGHWPLPPLAGVVELPVLRPDGTFAVDHGYDGPTRLYHWHHGAPYAAIPVAPTADQLADAVALVDDILADFPWDTTADRANAWGLLLTPLVRATVAQVPMALVDAPEPGTGKGLLVDVVASLMTGRDAPKMPWPTSEEELEKKVTTALLAGSTIVVWDNVEGIIRSGTLAAVLTADAWQGRILGRSEQVIMPNRATWVATGNNLDVGGDLARRCYRIRLDARQAQPWKRTNFRHRNLLDHVRTHRTEILGAMCTVVAAWVAAGRPEAGPTQAMGGYTSWVRTVGGILSIAGIAGFLENLDEFHAQADQDARQWEAFLSVWHDRYGEAPTTTAELVDRVRDVMCGSRLRDVLPEDLISRIDNPGFNKSLGRALRQRAGRHYGTEGIHLVELPPDRRQVAIWCVTTRSVQLFEDPTDLNDRGFERVKEQKPAPRDAPTSTDAPAAGFADFEQPLNARDTEQEPSKSATATDPKETRETYKPAPNDDLGLF